MCVSWSSSHERGAGCASGVVCRFPAQPRNRPGMKISSAWLRDFVHLDVDDRRLAADLTLTGTAVESILEGGIFEMEITTNRPDCMNHHGIARECSAIYDLALQPIATTLPPAHGSADFPIAIEEAR